MLRTLQFYICRELIKTFALTTFGLTLVFSLTGGVFNMMRAEVLSAVQMLHLLVLGLPLAMTLTLPVAALFSCAMVYGRLAADNEFDACRASGINIHRLLAPSFGLSIVTFIFTFIFANYVLPSSIQNVKALVRKDLQKIIVAALNMQGHFKLPTAVKGSVILYSGQPPRSEQGPDGTHIELGSAAFINIENERLVGVGTANQVRANFYSDSNGEPIVDAGMFDVRAYDFDQKRLYVTTHQPIDPIAVPNMFTELKTKWLNLTKLLRYRQAPLEFTPIQRQITGLRGLTRDGYFYAWVVNQFNGSEHVLRLNDANGQLKYEIHAKGAVNDPTDFRPLLDHATVKEVLDGRTREWQAERCNLKVATGFASAPYIVQLRLAGGVHLTDTLDREHKQVEKPDTALEAVPLPGFVATWAEQRSDLELLGITQDHIRLARDGKLPTDPPPPTYRFGNRVESARLRTLGTLAEQALQIVGVIHSRLAFSASALVMLVLASTLAIIFRGGQLLTAFVISFIPGLIVVVLNVAGRQMSEKPHLHLIGLAIIWSGLGLLALADVVVLSKFLKR